MAETPPKNLCLLCRDEIVEGQVLCPTCLAAVGLGDRKTDAPASSDGEIRTGEPPDQRRPVNPPALDAPDIRTSRPTAVGCMLVLGCVAIIFGIAIPVVRWHDPETGYTLPRTVSVFLPVLAGAMCYAIGAGICKLLGVRLYKVRSQTSAGNA